MNLKFPAFPAESGYVSMTFMTPSLAVLLHPLTSSARSRNREILCSLYNARIIGRGFLPPRDP